MLYVIFLATEAPGTPSMTTSEPETPSMTTEEPAGNLDFDILFADNADKLSRFRFILLFHHVIKSDKKLSFLSVFLYMLMQFFFFKKQMNFIENQLQCATMKCRFRLYFSND